MKRSLYILFLACGLVFASCRESFIDVPPPPGGNVLGDLYYTDTYSYGSSNIYTVKEDGSGRMKLLSHASLYSQPYGGEFAFTKGDDLFIGYLDSTPPLRVLTVRDISYSALSPDGKKILYLDHDKCDHHSKLHIIDLASRNDIEVADGVSDKVSPTFSPDGSLAAFVTVEDYHGGHDDSRLVVVNTSSGDVTEIADNVNTFDGAQLLSWTSDNSSIVIIKNAEYGMSQIFLVPVRGGNSQQITFDNMMKSDAVISPAGDKIIYRGATKNSFDLYAIPITGGTPEALTATPDVLESYPAFSNDGKKIVFSAHQVHFPPDSTQYPNDIRVMDLSTKETTTIANGCYRAFWKK